MLDKKSNFAVTLLNIILFGFVIIFQTSGFIDINIKNASPMLIIPLITAYCVHSSVGHSLAAGFIVGACMDAVSVGAYCFNTIVFVLLAVGICVASNNLFNKNIKATAALCIIAAIIYYLSKFAVFYLYNHRFIDSLGYLVQYAFPSAVYSAVFIFPFYYLYKYFEKLKG